MKVMIAIALVSAVLCTVFAHQDDVARWDPNMAANGVVVDTNGVKWIDGKNLPIEGRAFDDVARYYDRLPANVTTNVNGGVRGMKSHTAGMIFRFKTDSRNLHFRWTPTNLGNLAMDHMPATGVSGIDVYRWDEGKRRWLYAGACRMRDLSKKEFSLDLPWTPGAPCIVNLPLYNGIKSFSLGVDENAYVRPLGPRRNGIDKPVVFYGTSITHGACASRPGLAFVNRVGRDLDVPVVNLGFAGSGRMEMEMVDHLARIDASCYVLDCLWNMSKPNAAPGAAFHDMYAAGFDENDEISVVRFRYEPFIRALRAKRPGVPIVMAEQCDVFARAPNAKDKFIRALYEKLVAEGWDKLVYLPKDRMYTGDLEGSAEGCHPNDIGMESLARAFGEAVKKALGLDR